MISSDAPNLPINKHSSNDSKQPSSICVKKAFNEYTLFALLEHERNAKLKEVYHRRCVSQDNCNETQGENDLLSGLSVPTRYQMLDLSAEWFMNRLNKSRQPMATAALQQEWSALDRKSMLFIQDVAAVLRFSYSEYCLEEYCRSNSAPVNSLPPAPYSPRPKKPKNLFQAFVWEARRSSSDARKSLSPMSSTRNDRSRTPEIRRSSSSMLSTRNERNRTSVYGEVDISDSEIRALWDQSVVH
jgi:hypothetical protein